jgi:hypothetical protein
LRGTGRFSAVVRTASAALRLARPEAAGCDVRPPLGGGVLGAGVARGPDVAGGGGGAAAGVVAGREERDDDRPAFPSAGGGAEDAGVGVAGGVAADVAELGVVADGADAAGADGPGAGADAGCVFAGAAGAPSFFCGKLNSAIANAIITTAPTPT